jgi:asparagine synthase (glutamine-hydrolysing)
MCGICGVFRPDRGRIDVSRVERMREAVMYRGPDACGLSHGPGYALGHRRLSIIDLSENGLQPMSNEDGVVEIVLNGEIYNFRELKCQLQTKGHIFRSATDTEVLVHGYEEWGINRLLGMIRGMYAFVIIDHREHVIHLARDPLGKKPLFFRLGQNELAFASSARALACGLAAPPEVDAVGIDNLLWNLYVPGPETIFVGVEKLLPGHALSLGCDGIRREIVHWQPDFLHPEEGLEDDEWLERIENALETAVNRRLAADVPVGTLLSGGVDSSLVTAVAAKLAGQIQTFSVATEDPRLDESQFARAVAERCGTRHHQLEVRGDIRKDLCRLIGAMGEPLADASAANTFAIAEQARQFVTVVLTGDGGDEGFGGYRQYLAYYFAGYLSQFGSSLLKLPLWALNRIPLNGTSPLHSARTLFRLASAPLEETLFSDSMAMDEAARESLYTPEFKDRLRQRHPRQHYLRVLPPVDNALAVDRVMETKLLTVLPDDYLTKVDNATMAVSLEARSPFLDLDLVELGMRIPAAVRFRGGKSKSLLCRLAERYVPVKCVRRRKQGFVAPIGKWIRTDWPDLVEQMVLGPQVEQRQWFRRQALQQIVEEHRHGIDHGYLLWGLIVLELWVRLSVEGTLQPGDVV